MNQESIGKKETVCMKPADKVQTCAVPEVAKMVESVVSRTQKMAGYLFDRLGRIGGRKKRKKRIISIE
jgi:hypothetical protein